MPPELLLHPGRSQIIVNTSRVAQVKEKVRVALYHHAFGSLSARLAFRDFQGKDDTAIERRNPHIEWGCPVENCVEPGREADVKFMIFNCDSRE